MTLYASDLFAAEIGEVSELDLHGMSVDEAIKAVEFFLHAEFMAGTRAVRLVHGQGSGALQRALHVHLKTQPLVADFRAAESQQAITVVALYPRL